MMDHANRRSVTTPLALLVLVAATTLWGADDPRPVVDASRATTPAATNPALPTLYVVGDSTAQSDAPLRGWGAEIGAFFDPAKMNVVNRAIGGRSTRTLMIEGRWDKILAELRPGDFVLIQFGHNDSGDYKDPKAKGRPSIHGEGDETAEAVKADLTTLETIHSFGWYMRQYASETKAKGAAPILLSMVPHKDWRDGTIVRNERDTFVRWTRNAAQATGALFVDANRIIAEGLERLGPEKVEAFFGDLRTHSTPQGARYNAAAVIVGLAALNPNPLAAYFTPLAADLPPSLRTNGPTPQGPMSVFVEGARILFQGDSITDGNRGRNTDPNHILGHGYQFVISSKYGAELSERHLTFINRGISGDTVASLARRWQADTLDLKPDVLSILIGVNDLGMGVTAEQYEQQYDQLLADTVAARPNVRLVLCEPFGLPVVPKKEHWPTYRAALDVRRAIVARLATKYHAALVPFQKTFDDAALRAPADYWIWDGVHPTYSGHQLMADEWIRAVQAYWPATN